MSRAKAFRGGFRRSFGLLLAPLLIAFSCANEGPESTGGETHFLMRCDASANACGASLACLCGVCTLPCSERTECQAFPSAACIAASGEQACSDSQARGHCDVECVADVDCKVVSPAHRCEQGSCRASALSNEAGAGGRGSEASGGGGGSAGTNACEHGRVSANEVLLIGDSFFAASHQITAYLEELGRNAGALPIGERYRDNSTLTANALAFPSNAIANQYASGVAEASVKVVIMNGGGADVLLGTCSTADSSCTIITDAAAAVRALLATMEMNGTQQVVYAFYPDPVDNGVRAKMDALRPLVQSACADSVVPCHWLDLRATFAGHYGDYVQADGLNPTDAGSRASASAIWATLEQYCIGQ